jgi:putative membrane protein (TIGR04086 family)
VTRDSVLACSRSSAGARSGTRTRVCCVRCEGAAGNLAAFQHRHHDERLHASCEQAEAEEGLNNLFAFIANCYNRGSFYMRHGSREMSSTRIHWARILLGGLLAEVALILAIVPLGLRLGDNFLRYTAAPGSFVMCFLGALWVCRRIESHFILHGTLVGVVAALIYVALTRAQPEPFAYIVAHALKLVGGACGGFVAQRRRSPSPVQPVYD